jgi:glycerophosphoryl diester phosphodiesterase
LNDRPGTLRLAHRGDSRVAPENTLAALLAATRIPGCDGVEFDVRASADRVPVVIHDTTLARVQGRLEAVNHLTARQLEDLGVPTLEETLALLPRRAFLDVELKEDVGPGVVAILAGGRGPDLGRTVVSSFDLAVIRRIRSLAPGWPCWLNTYDLSADVIGAAVHHGCRGVAAEWHAITHPMVTEVRRNDLQLSAFTVRRRPTYNRLARLGVAAICAEGPALDGNQEAATAAAGIAVRV